MIVPHQPPTDADKHEHYMQLALEQARRADSTLGRARAREVGSVLAGAYLSAARDAFSSQRYSRAMTFARKSLAQDSGNGDARRMRDQLEAKAPELFDDAMKARNAGDDTRARRLLQDVLGVAKQGSTIYRKAHNALQSF